MGKKKLPKGLYWRGKTIWCRTDPVTGKQVSTHCSDERAAQLWLAKREREAVDPVHAAAQRATVGEWCVKTVAYKRSARSTGTLHMYEVKLGHVVRLFGADSSMNCIDAGGIDRYLMARLDEGAKPNTIAREFSCLRQLLKLAKRAGCYPHDLDSVFPVGFSAEYQPVTRTLNPDDLPALLEALQTDEERAWVCLAIATAADAGDIERARPEDYDPARNVFLVRGRKTTSRHAEVPILPHVQELFEYALARLPVSWPRASKGLGEACARAGIPHLSPKDLRRTAASLLVASGAQQSLVSRFLRHRSDAMVRTVYGQVRPEELGRLLGSTDVTKTLRAPLRPLGGKADAGDLKDDPPLSGVAAPSGKPRVSRGRPGRKKARVGAPGVTDSLHPAPAFALSLAYENALLRRGLMGVPQ